VAERRIQKDLTPSMNGQQNNKDLPPANTPNQPWHSPEVNGGKELIAHPARIATVRRVKNIK
jgi:hypothetical protein